MKSPSGLWDSNLNPQVWFLGFLYLYFTLFANTTYKKQTNQKNHVFMFSKNAYIQNLRLCFYMLNIFSVYYI